MKRRSDDDDALGLDSLLDTLTNVVGILVIVLVVTQLGVGDAVQRITDTEQVDPAALEAARNQLVQLEHQQQLVQQQISDFEPIDPAQQAVRIAGLEGQIANQQRQLRQVEQTKNEFAAKLAAERTKAAAAQAEIDSITKNREELKQELTALLAKKASLEAILDQTPERQQLAARVVSLPNPRPAPDGAQQVTFVCANNKVYPLNLDQFRDTAQKRAAYVVRAERLDRNPAAGIDPKAFVEAFNSSKPLHDDFFTVEMQAPGGRYPRLVFHPRENGGVDEQELLGARSRFNRMLDQADKSKYYARFHVLPDSYDIYITARKVISDADMLAGWEPEGESWTYSASLGGSLRLGPPSPPPDPNAPKPPAQPTAPPPNVID